MKRALATGHRKTCSDCGGTGTGSYGLHCFVCAGKGVRLVWTFVGQDWVSDTLSRIARGGANV